MNTKTSDKMSIVLKICFAVLLALLVALASVESASTGVTEEPTTESVTRQIATTEEVEILFPPVRYRPRPTTRPPKVCDASYSCGWAAYNNTPFSRTMTFHIKNTCVCPTGEHCIRDMDDFSNSQYVYKCRVKRTNATPPTLDYYNH